MIMSKPEVSSKFDEFFRSSLRFCYNFLRCHMNMTQGIVFAVFSNIIPIYTVCPNECKVVLLDEPDAHLHPNMQIVNCEWDIPAIYLIPFLVKYLSTLPAHFKYFITNHSFCKTKIVAENSKRIKYTNYNIYSFSSNY